MSEEERERILTDLKAEDEDEEEPPWLSDAEIELLESDPHEAPKTDPRYYFRPYKTVLLRSVADGGTSHYVQGDHRQTVPALYDQIIARAAR